MVDAAAADPVAGQQIPQLLRDKWILLEVIGLPFAHMRLVDVGSAPHDVDFHFPKVGQHGQRETLVPRVAFRLEGVAGMKFLAGFLGFAYEAVALVGSEQIISPFLSALNPRAAFDLHFALRLNQTGAVLQIPAEGAEEGVEEIVAKLGFDIPGFFEFRQIALKDSDQTGELFLERFKTAVSGHGGYLYQPPAKEQAEASWGGA